MKYMQLMKVLQEIGNTTNRVVDIYTRGDHQILEAEAFSCLDCTQSAFPETLRCTSKGAVHYVDIESIVSISVREPVVVKDTSFRK
jgi:hypothetical protein